MSDLTRRDALRALAATSLATALDWTPAQAQRALGLAAAARAPGAQPYQPKFFSAHEWDTVRVLVDLIIPRDERSGSATDAGVPEFMDFLLVDGDDGPRVVMRGGLAWIDNECVERFGHAFMESADAERTALLDLIAWPAKAPPELSQGVAFFNRFRDLTASGFWSSKMGITDLQYMGNTAVPQWTGCPPEALAKLGVRYDEG
jgi:gluconate 2-dehydrogenase gamma chain